MTKKDIYEKYCELQGFITDRMNELNEITERPDNSIEYCGAFTSYQELNKILTKSNELLENI